MDTWRFFRCDGCGRTVIGHVGEDTTFQCCDCNTTVRYSAKVEEEWFNETDENGKRLRMDFKGSSELDCRQKAAEYFGCDYRDINYYIMQKSGLFKPFIIRAEKKKEYEVDADAEKIVLWKYEGRDKYWLTINPQKRTILYPRVSDKVIKYDKIVALEHMPKDSACTHFNLILEPQNEMEIVFFEENIGNIDKLISVLYDDLPDRNYGLYRECFFRKSDIDKTKSYGVVKMNCQTSSYDGVGYIWVKDGELCISDGVRQDGLRIKVDDIKYFRLIGDKYVTTEVSGGGGGGSSIKGAIIGGLIAGEAGAIIGSRKEVAEVKSNSVIHDEQSVLLYDKSLKQVLKFNADIYKIFLKLIPEKEYDVVVQNNDSDDKTSNQGDNFEAIKKLKDLYEQGILSSEEYETKKKELLSRI